MNVVRPSIDDIRAAAAVIDGAGAEANPMLTMRVSVRRQIFISMFLDGGHDPGDCRDGISEWQLT